METLVRIPHGPHGLFMPDLNWFFASRFVASSFIEDASVRRFYNMDF